MSFQFNVVLSRKALEIAVRGLKADMESIANEINNHPRMLEHGFTVTPDEVEKIVREAKIQTRNLKRAERSYTFVVESEEQATPSNSLSLPQMVLDVQNNNPQETISEEREAISGQVMGDINGSENLAQEMPNESLGEDLSATALQA
jgi:hypothetical protein